MKLLIAVLAAAASFGTSAMADAPLAGDDCVLIKDIRNHTVVDQNTDLAAQPEAPAAATAARNRWCG